ncbi:MAG: hypothetical protein JNL52_14870 [Flavobacteriales bacterium]|nr:hypothetical protein [Flavobacteriales bacterium]
MDPRWWCHGLSWEGLEIQFVRGHGLVLIDRQPTITGPVRTWLNQPIKGPGGIYATPVDEPRPYRLKGLLENETMLHSVHGGSDGGSVVLLDQYLLMQDECPELLIRTITLVNGRKTMDEAMHHDLLMRLLGRNTTEPTTDAPR